MKFICEQCKAKYQIADDKVAGKTVRMKCRKCGHQIEVRAAVTESSVASKAPAAGASGPPRADSAAPAAQKPSAPRPSALATSLASAKPSPPRHAAAPGAPAPERPGALAGAFKSGVASKEEEISASFDLNELSAADEWYVAINGVPVGPIRVAEIRRKAAVGAVNDESLCWQEGLEEWRPLKAFAELAAVVHEAATSGRNSLLTPQPPDVRTSAPPAAPHAPRPQGARAPTAQRPGAAAIASPAAKPAAPPQSATAAANAAAAAARNNVVPITSRLAVAERLDDATVPLTDEVRGALVVPDPFASPPAAEGGGAAILSAPAPVGAVAQAQDVPPLAILPTQATQKKQTPWLGIAVVVLAASFGITAGLAFFLRPAPPAPVVIAAATNAPMGQQAAPLGSGAPAPTATDSGPLPMASGASSSRPLSPAAASAAAAYAAAHPTAAPSASGAAFSLSGLGAARPNVDPTLGAGGGDTSKAPGQCLSAGQIQSVIAQQEFGVKRTCWDKASTTKQAVSIGVTVSIGPGGEVASVNATGDDNSVAACVSSNVKRWHFPAGGCSQQTYFKLNFVRQ